MEQKKTTTVTLKSATDLALKHLKAGEYQLSKNIFLDILKAYPDNAHANHYIGVCYFNLNETELALEHLKKAIELLPDNSNFNHNLGSVYNQLEQLDKALPYLQKAAAIEPDNAIFVANLAVVTAKRGDLEQAKQIGLQALHLKDKNAVENFKEYQDKYILKEKQIAKDYQPNDVNIIAFCLFGDNPLYTKGAVMNAMLVPYIYPEWRARFFIDKTVPAEIVEQLKKFGAEIAFFENPKKGFHRLLWRFLISDDPNVTRFICRDCDSRLNVQEKIAVDEWVQSGKYFHIMRNSYHHCELILAGMWGGVAGILPPMEPLINEFECKVHEKWHDQAFAGAMLWPLVKQNVLTHDSFYHYHHARDFSKFGRRPLGFDIGTIESWDLDRL